MSITYKISEWVGKGMTKNSLKKFLNQTYEISKELGELAVLSVTKGIPKSIEFYFVSNFGRPIIQKRYIKKHKCLEDFEGIITLLSSSLNSLVYPIISSLIKGDTEFWMGWGIWEGFIRSMFAYTCDPPRSIASLPGKIIGLPLEAILGIYDGYKEKKINEAWKKELEDEDYAPLCSRALYALAMNKDFTFSKKDTSLSDLDRMVTSYLKKDKKLFSEETCNDKCSGYVKIPGWPIWIRPDNDNKIKKKIEISCQRIIPKKLLKDKFQYDWELVRYWLPSLFNDKYRAQYERKKEEKYTNYKKLINHT